MRNKYFLASVATVVAVSVVPTVADAEVAKPYEKISFKDYGKKSYSITVSGLKEPVILMMSDGTESFFPHALDSKELQYTFGIYLGTELYIQIVSQDKKTVYDTIFFNTETGKYSFNYNIANYDYSKLTHPESRENMPFVMNEVKQISAKTTRIAFEKIKTDVTLYNYDTHEMIRLKTSNKPITYDIPTDIYLLIDTNSTFEVGELHLNGAEGYTYNPDIFNTYYRVEYAKRIWSLDEDLSQLKVNWPKEVKAIEVKEDATKPYFEKTAAQIAQEKFIAIDKTTLKDISKNGHRDAIVLLNKLSIITGYQDGTFKPSKTLTYSDIIKLVGRYAKVPVLAQSQVTAGLATKYGTKSAEIVSYLEVLEDVFGSNITYSASVTRGEFAIILSNLIEHLASEETGEPVNLTSFIKEKGFESDYVVKNSKYKNAVTTLHYFGITQLDNGQFNDDKTLNRGQLASFLSRIYAINFDQFK